MKLSWVRVQRTGLYKPEIPSYGLLSVAADQPLGTVARPVHRFHMVLVVYLEWQMGHVRPKRAKVQIEPAFLSVSEPMESGVIFCFPSIPVVIVLGSFNCQPDLR